MKPVRFVCLMLTLGCLLGVIPPALAAQVDCQTTYCFSSGDFALSEEPLAGICITELPGQSGSVCLGTRILRPGDILTAEQISMMTFSPLESEEDTEAVIGYLPIYEDRVAPCASMTISVRGKRNDPPVAQDSSVETYKNIPNEGALKVSDPEGEGLTYTLIRPPKRGDVELRDDGTFLYTPKKNKVGVDSFPYTATDPAGNISREATVTIQILKPTDANVYTDTTGYSCRFEAEWLRNTGLFVGESVNGQSCFQPDKTVTRGEFLAMMVKSLDIPTDDAVYTAIPEDTPQWLKPYLAAAIRSGLTNHLPDTQTAAWAEAPISGAEAAVMLQNALDLSLSDPVLQTIAAQPEDVPAWAASSVSVMEHSGITLSPLQTLTRAQAAEVLYQASILAMDAPGMAVFRMQK